MQGVQGEPVGALLRRVFTRITGDAAGDASASRDAVVLDVLATHDGSSQRELAERLGINRTIMVKLVDRLEAAGWAARERRPDDRRSYALRLTPAGEAALGRLREEVSDRDAHITAGLSDAERARLHELLGGLLPDPGTPPVASTEFLVAQAHHRLRRVADGLLADTGLRMPHAGPLAALEAGPSQQRDVARGLAITEPATAELVDELVTAGLVTRERDPDDRRRYALQLTPAGRQRLTRIREVQREIQAHVAGLLGTEEVDELRELLLRLLAQPPAE